IPPSPPGEGESALYIPPSPPPSPPGEGVCGSSTGGAAPDGPDALPPLPGGEGGGEGGTFDPDLDRFRATDPIAPPSRRGKGVRGLGKAGARGRPTPGALSKAATSPVRKSRQSSAVFGSL